MVTTHEAIIRNFFNPQNTQITQANQQADSNGDKGSLQADIRAVKSIVNESKRLDEQCFSHHGTEVALSALPPVRRGADIPEEVEEKNYSRALAIGSVVLLNMPEDWRDMKESWKQLKCWISGNKYVPSYDYKKYQHPFSFFRGTLVEPALDIQKNKENGLGRKLYELDIPIYYTKIGEFIKKILNIEIDMEKSIFTSRIDRNGFNVPAFVIKNKGFKGTIGRAMLRMPAFTFGALSLVEIPTIVKKAKEAKENKVKEGFQQTLRSAISIILIQIGIGLGGAVAFKKWGAAASLAGMGLGATIGGCSAKKINDYI